MHLNDLEKPFTVTVSMSNHSKQQEITPIINFPSTLQPSYRNLLTPSLEGHKLCTMTLRYWLDETSCEMWLQVTAELLHWFTRMNYILFMSVVWKYYGSLAECTFTIIIHSIHDDTLDTVVAYNSPIRNGILVIIFYYVFVRTYLCE